MKSPNYQYGLWCSGVIISFLIKDFWYESEYEEKSY